MVQTPLVAEHACVEVEAAVRLCEARGVAVPGAGAGSARDAACTGLMEAWRLHRDPSSFEALARLAQPVLAARARARVRAMGCRIDPAEVVQDTLVNVYRYPHQFHADRPGAFAAWSTTILDNVIRRHLRRNHMGRPIRLQEDEILAQQADARGVGPERAAEDAEERDRLATVWTLFLALYHRAWLELGERERYVLGLVELHGMRYAEVAAVTGSRPEALKMVVFRARKRIHERIGSLLAIANAPRGGDGTAVPAA